MSNKTLRITFILSVICVIMMIAMQFLWIKKAYQLEKSIFNTHVTIALKNVAIQLLRMNENNSTVDSIVTQVDEKYYTVQVNDKIDSTALEYLLRRELLAQQIKTDFEYSVYDCESEKVRYGKYISYSNNDKEADVVKTLFPKKKGENNYFGVHFPQLATFLTKEMSNWFISTFVLFLFMLILAYAIFIIFRQKRLSEIQKDFVNNMTHEFKTPLATIKLSSEVLKNPNILILDEATSALDTESEKLVQDALDQLMQERTVLIIAHRLSTVRKADEIIVLSQGKIIERGNHDALMALKGTYFNLCSLQGMRD